MTHVFYYFEDDKLCRVIYELVGGGGYDGDASKFVSMNSACEALGIKYDRTKYDNGYYACYMDDTYVEVHPFSKGKYPDEEEKYYVLFEPTYELSIFGRSGHKHEWSISGCGDHRVCKSCGKEATNYRYHILDDKGFCTMCNENRGIPLSEENIENYLVLYVDGKGGPDYIDVNCTIIPVNDTLRFKTNILSINVYCDKYCPDENKMHDWLGTIEIDERGNGSGSQRIYNILEARNFQLGCSDRDRVYLSDQSQ